MRVSISHARLPPELWMRVFYWATYGSARNTRLLLDVPLFDGISHYEDEMQTEGALRTKATLALVCKQWRVLSEQYLFEDLKIRHGKHILADVFERSKKNCPQALGKGRHVVRIVLPNLQMSIGYGHSQHWADEVTSRIIKCCPNFLVLSRYHRTPAKDFMQHESELHSNPSDENGECCLIHDPPLPSLRRLDWFSGSFGDTSWSPTICAIPSRLWSAQGIESLSLAGDNYFWGPIELQSLTGQIILLPNVRTLRVGSIHAFGVPAVSGYTLALPSLRRIILDRGEALHRLIESVIALPKSSPNGEPFLPEVKILEVGSPHWRFTRSDYISTLIRHYPTAESLYYPVFFARPLRWRRLQNNGLSYGPSEPGKMFPSLCHVGLHGEQNPELSYPKEIDKTEALWSHLYAHVRALLGCSGPNLIESRFPNISSITLYGASWLPFIDDHRFHIILDLVQQRGAEIRGEHASVADALEDAIFEYQTSLLLDWIYAL